MRKYLLAGTIIVLSFSCGSPREDARATVADSPPDKKSDTAPVTRPSPPEVPEFALSGCSLTLSGKAQQALESHAPGFMPWKRSDFAQDCGASDALYKCDSMQAPFAVIGDFNGDHLKDIVISGHDKQYTLVLCLLTEKDSFRVVEIERSKGVPDPKKRLPQQLDSEVGLQEYLIHVSPRQLKTDWEEQPLKLETNAFEMIYCGKASELYYYKDGAFHTYTTSD